MFFRPTERRISLSSQGMQPVERTSPCFSPFKRLFPSRVLQFSRPFPPSIYDGFDATVVVPDAISISGCMVVQPQWRHWILHHGREWGVLLAFPTVAAGNMTMVIDKIYDGAQLDDFFQPSRVQERLAHQSTAYYCRCPRQHRSIKTATPCPMP